MCPKKSEVSGDVKKLIVDHFNSGLSQHTISQLVNRPRSTVQSILRKWKNENTVQNKPRLGRPKARSDANERWLVRQVKKEPKTNASILAKSTKECLQIDVTPQTIRNYLKNNNYRGRTARRKPYISKKNRIVRLNFTKSFVNQPEEFWNNVIFADESKFNLFGCDGKIIVYRKPNTELDERHTVATVKHGGGGIMVWGCMAANGVGKIEPIHQIMDHIGYINILKRNLRSSTTTLGLDGNFHFWQDNDPKHSAQNTKLWLLYNCPKVIKTPAQSPDLNPIENLWSHLERKIRQREFSNKNQMQKILLEEWNKIDPALTKKLVKSMPKRLKEVIRRKGKATKY